MVLKLTFDVDASGDAGAGLPAYTDTVVVTLESGKPGGEPGEFEQHLRGCLAEWFDGAHVELRVEANRSAPELVVTLLEQMSEVAFNAEQKQALTKIVDELPKGVVIGDLIDVLKAKEAADLGVPPSQYKALLTAIQAFQVGGEYSHLFAQGVGA